MWWVARIHYFDAPSSSPMAGQQRTIILPHGPAPPVPEELLQGSGAASGVAIERGGTATIVHPATVQAQALLPGTVARREVLLGFWDNAPQRASEVHERPKRTDLPQATKQRLPSRLDSPMFEMSMMLILTIIAILIERIAIYWFMVPF